MSNMVDIEICSGMSSWQRIKSVENIPFVIRREMETAARMSSAGHVRVRAVDTKTKALVDTLN